VKRGFDQLRLPPVTVAVVAGRVFADELVGSGEPLAKERALACKPTKITSSGASSAVSTRGFSRATRASSSIMIIVSDVKLGAERFWLAAREG
jgi:hypothetical protein